VEEEQEEEEERADTTEEGEEVAVRAMQEEEEEGGGSGLTSVHAQGTDQLLNLLSLYKKWQSTADFRFQRCKH
jgi:hypothetical protein